MLIGTAYSVLIRLELSGPGVQFIADNQLVRRTFLTIYTDYFLNIISASKLGKGESPKLNTASLLKRDFRINLEILTYLWAALFMIKAILLEVYLIGAYIIGPNLARDRISFNELELVNWILTKGHLNWGVNYTYNLGKGLSKNSINGIVNRNFGIAYSPLRPRQRKDHSTIFTYPLFIQIINGKAKLFGRVLGKYVSTLAKAAATYSIIKINGQSKVDNSMNIVKKQQLNITTVKIKIKIYNLLRLSIVGICLQWVFNYQIPGTF